MGRIEMIVVVPVFNAADALRRCLRALSEHCPATQPLLLIDDASTDPQIHSILQTFAERPGVELRQQTTNLGFVKTINCNLESTESDVVILNSDTQVTPGWLAALSRCAAADPTIATATPFSNNAEICSIPDFCQNNPVPEDPDLVAQALRATAPPSYPELPTGVGFCMYIRRAAWLDLDGFDEQFGLGYGEENDFCRRAVKAGWRNVLCDDAYVVHEGGQSFAQLGLAPGGDNAELLLDRHPDYDRLIGEFIAKDPLAARRAEILSECRRRHILLPCSQ